MNIDLTIHRNALKETQSLAVAQVLVARQRQDLEMKIHTEVATAAEPRAANVATALRQVDEASAARAQAAGPRVDRLA